MSTFTEIYPKLPQNIQTSLSDYDSVAKEDLYALIEEIVYHDNLDAFKAVIEAGCDVNLQNKYGWTLLHITIRRDRRDMVAFLLEKNADIDKIDGVGWTPLMEAIMDDLPDLCGYLVEKGADTSIANARGVTAPMLVQKFGRQNMVAFFS